ncbi:MAG: nitroreductase family protein [Gaiellales bacterium]
MNLDLTPDQLLSTTRAVRKRLDLTRPVARELVEECLRLAVQAPSSTNQQTWSFVVVTDPSLRAGLADIYRRAWMSYSDTPPEQETAGETAGQSSSRYLTVNLRDVPVHVLPCVEGRPEGQSAPELAALYGSIMQAAWSFQLAARARGLGSVFTTYHQDLEKEAADLLGLPFDRVTQVGLIPLAHTIGTDFRPARRRPMDEVVHWERW